MWNSIKTSTDVHDLARCFLLGPEQSVNSIPNVCLIHSLIIFNYLHLNSIQFEKIQRKRFNRMVLTKHVMLM